MNPRIARTSLLALAGTLIFSGTVLAADPVKVVASVKPIHSLVAGVMQGVAEPSLLVKGAASPHSFNLRPSDARALNQADLVFWVGEDLETFLTKPIQSLAGKAQPVALMEESGLTLLPTREGGAWEKHEDHGHEATTPMKAMARRRTRHPRRPCLAGRGQCAEDGRDHSREIVGARLRQRRPLSGQRRIVDGTPDRPGRRAEDHAGPRQGPPLRRVPRRVPLPGGSLRPERGRRHHGQPRPAPQRPAAQPAPVEDLQPRCRLRLRRAAVRADARRDGRRKDRRQARHPGPARARRSTTAPSFTSP